MLCFHLLCPAGEASDFVSHSSCLMFSDCREKIPLRIALLAYLRMIVSAASAIWEPSTTATLPTSTLMFLTRQLVSSSAQWTRCVPSTRTITAPIPPNLKPASFSQIPDLKRGQPGVNFARLGPQSARLNMSARQESSSTLMESPSTTTSLRSQAFMQPC